jgi:hypothetical protein
MASSGKGLAKGMRLSFSLLPVGFAAAACACSRRGRVSGIKAWGAQRLKMRNHITVEVVAQPWIFPSLGLNCPALATAGILQEKSITQQETSNE